MPNSKHANYKEEFKKLLAKVMEFLDEFRPSSDGGWAPVEKEDWEQLHEILRMLIEIKWGADADGDRPINFTLIDRTKCEPMHFRPVPYDIRLDPCSEEYNECFADHLANLNIATDRVNVSMRVRGHERRARKAAAEKKKEGQGKPEE